MEKKKSRRYEGFRLLKSPPPRRLSEHPEKLAEAARNGGVASKRQGHHLRHNPAPFLRLS